MIQLVRIFVTGAVGTALSGGPPHISRRAELRKSLNNPFFRLLPSACHYSPISQEANHEEQAKGQPRGALGVLARACRSVARERSESIALQSGKRHQAERAQLLDSAAQHDLDSTGAAKHC